MVCKTERKKTKYKQLKMIGMGCKGYSKFTFLSVGKYIHSFFHSFALESAHKIRLYSVFSLSHRFNVLK